MAALNSRDERSRPTTYEYDGRTYVAYETTAEVAARDMLGPGTENGCGYKGPYSWEIAMHNVNGVRPRVSVVSAVDARAIYIAQGAGVSDLPPDVAAMVVE